MGKRHVLFSERRKFYILFDCNNLIYGKAQPPIQNYDVIKDMIEAVLTNIMAGANVTEWLNQLNTDVNSLP